VNYYVTDYPDNSRSAVLRVAIQVACADGNWTELEREQLEGVYRNICIMLDDDLDDDLFLWELDTIASDVAGEIENLSDDEETEAYWETCLAAIVSDDIQELTVAAALALSSADSELDVDELAGLSRLCDEWDVSIQDAQDIWSD
jgi:tellurite resistance protein